MSHLRADRLADLAAGRLSESALASAQTHLADCERCQGALARIEAGRLAMAEIKETKAPELGWDSIGARVYWTTSSEQRARGRERRRGWRWPAFGVAAVAAVAAVSLWGLGSEEQPAETMQATESLPVEPQEMNPSQVEEMVELLSGLVTFAQGDVRVGGQPLDFDQEIAVGAQLSAGEGGLVVQFGEHSAFRLAAQSKLRVTRFDTKRIELDVVGVVDVDITRRLPGQEFVVRAGEHEVVVRGTAFRVEYNEGSLGVSCTRGQVVVTGEDDMVPVPAGQAFRVLSEAWDEASLQARPMDAEALQALDRAMVMPMLPAWSERELLSEATTVLEVSAAPTQSVAIDGVSIAQGSFFLRAMSGRHQVALMDASGEPASETWVDGIAGQRLAMNVTTAPRKPKAPMGAGKARGLRRGQMQAALEKSQRTDRCLAPLAKQGLADGSFVVFDIGVNADGSQDYLNVLDTNLSPIIVKCMRKAVDAESLPEGPIAGFRLRLSF
jgi:ferric-dicitrate binding protein FerR (iron transport regulator)